MGHGGGDGGGGYGHGGYDGGYDHQLTDGYVNTGGHDSTPVGHSDAQHQQSASQHQIVHLSGLHQLDELNFISSNKAGPFRRTKRLLPVNHIFDSPYGFVFMLISVLASWLFVLYWIHEHQGTKPLTREAWIHQLTGSLDKGSPLARDGSQAQSARPSTSSTVNSAGNLYSGKPWGIPSALYNTGHGNAFSAGEDRARARQTSFNEPANPTARATVGYPIYPDANAYKVPPQPHRWAQTRERGLAVNQQFVRVQPDENAQVPMPAVRQRIVIDR